MSRSALKSAVLMEISSFLNSADMFIRVLCDQPTDLAERQLWGNNLGLWGRKGDVFGGQGRKSGEASQGRKCKARWGAPQMCWGELAYAYLEARYTADSLFIHLLTRY